MSMTFGAAGAARIRTTSACSAAAASSSRAVLDEPKDKEIIGAQHPFYAPVTLLKISHLPPLLFRIAPSESLRVVQSRLGES
ncbi:unnamed protein product [Penicillium glandicola]